MALPASGAISLSQVNTELNLSSTAVISLNDTAVRNLAGVASGAISMQNLLGKSAFTLGFNGTAPLAVIAQDVGGRVNHLYFAFYLDGTIKLGEAARSGSTPVLPPLTYPAVVTVPQGVVPTRWATGTANPTDFSIRVTGSINELILETSTIASRASGSRDTGYVKFATTQIRPSFYGNGVFAAFGTDGGQGTPSIGGITSPDATIFIRNDVTGQVVSFGLFRTEGTDNT
jgi:hypothetical protein